LAENKGTDFDLDPNYDTVKRRSSSAVIKAPTKINPKHKIVKKMLESPQKAKQLMSGGDELSQGSIETMRIEANDFPDGFSDMISDTTEYLGPGKYEPNYESVETSRSISFGKSMRFRPDKPDEREDVLPSLSAVKKSVPGTKIMKETPMNEKL